MSFFLDSSAPDGISIEERGEAVDLLHHHYETQCQIASLDREILDLAVSLTQTHRLRGYDAIQLATALAVKDSFSSSGLPEPAFVAAENPNDRS